MHFISHLCKSTTELDNQIPKQVTGFIMTFVVFSWENTVIDVMQLVRLCNLVYKNRGIAFIDITLKLVNSDKK